MAGGWWLPPSVGSHGLVACQVLEAFKQGMNSDRGTDIKDVVAGLKSSGYSEQQVRQAVDYLATDGHLYNTVDDNHYQYTSRGDEW